MVLDQNLFTLNLIQDEKNPQVVSLVDPGGTHHYTKQRVPGNEYKIEVYDPLSKSLLVTATAPSATSKTKILELHNPSALIELKYTGTLSFRWSFKWEDHEFEWKREECFMVRKPDPPVLVAITREPAGRIKTTAVQILDYNLNRFDINDRKGLEIVILTALLTFQDSSDAYHAPKVPGAATASAPITAQRGSGSPTSSPPPPAPPPKPAPKTGVDRVAEMQALRGEINEVTVEDEAEVNDYAEYCAKLLEDDAMLFITIKSAAVTQVPKVLQVVEETKRMRHKAGLSAERELHQYVLYDTAKQKGPKRIILDDNDKSDKNKNKYTPPDSLTVHLSKIDMPELQPRATGKEKDKPSKESSKESRKAPAAKPPTPPLASRPSTTGLLNKFQRPHASNGSGPSAQSAQPPSTNAPNTKLLKKPSFMSFPTPQIPSRPPAAPAARLQPSSNNTNGPHHRPHSTSPTSPTHGVLGQSALPPDSVQPSSAPANLRPTSVVAGLFESLRRR